MLNRWMYINENENTAQDFQIIYQLASTLEINPKNLDTQAQLLTFLDKKDKNINVVHRGFSPVGVLAQEKKYHAVNFLLKCNASLEDALECAARVGDEAYVNKLLARKKDSMAVFLNYGVAALGYAFGGHHDLLEKLIKEVNELQPINDPSEFDGSCLKRILSDAAMGYAVQANQDKVNEFEERGATLASSLLGYCFANNVEKIKEYLLNRKLPTYTCISGYKRFGWVDRYINNGDLTLLRLFAACDLALCKKLLACLEMQSAPNASFDSIISEAKKQPFIIFISKIIELMSKWNINFQEAYSITTCMGQYELSEEAARAWLKPEVQVWILEGIQKIEEETKEGSFIPKGASLLLEIYLRIGAHLSELSYDNFHNLLDKMSSKVNHFLINKKILVKDLQKVLKHERETNSIVSHFSLFTECKNAANKEELIQIIESQPKGDFYQEHLEKPLEGLRKG